MSVLRSRNDELSTRRRSGTAEDVAAAIIALPSNDYITGVVLPRDGGFRFI